MKRSIERRLVVMFAIAALATFALASAALYAVLQSELARHQHEELDTNLQNLRYSIERTGDVERWHRVVLKLDTLTPADGRVRFWVLSDDPRFQYGKGLGEVEAMDHDIEGRGTLKLSGQAQPLRTLSVAIDAFGERPRVRLVVGSDWPGYGHTLRVFLGALLGVSLIGVLLVILAGHWIARVGLKPLEQLSREAQALRPRRLSQRLKLDDMPDELSGLTAAFNGALGRLEDAYRQLEAFNADVAHELRTPLANLIGGTQVALSRQRSAPALEETLQSNLEELERMRSIVNDMLFLARADQGEAATSLVRTLVETEVRRTIEFFEFVLDEAGNTVAIEGELTAEATIETSLFRRALSNLLQNAIEHSAPGARLTVRIEREAGWVWVKVCNPGLPVAEEHLRRLFDRFYRVDVSRHDRGQHHGHGLGLAIVKAVARMHGGSVVADSAGGITCIGFSVPAS